MRQPYSRATDQLVLDFLDSDQQWGPMLFLRPEPSQRWGALRLFAMCVLVGLSFGVPGAVVLSVLEGAFRNPSLGARLFPLELSLVYFCLCQLTLVPAWNRRATRAR